MARVDVLMPQMGESIAEGTLSKWLKKVGDAVKRDEPIFEISTDKVDAEIPAPAAGVLAEVLVTEGQTGAGQTIVARIETEQGASITPAAAAAAPSAAPAPTRHPAAAAASVPAPPAGNGLQDRLRTKSSPLVRKIAAEHGIELAAMTGSGIHGRVTRRDIQEYIDSGAAAQASTRPSMHAPGGVTPHGPTPEPWPGDRVEPMSSIPALTSEHM